MLKQHPWLLGAALVALGVGANAGQAADYPFVFNDVGDEAGLFPHVAGIRGHAAAWGDVDGDGWPDLFVGTFHNAGSKAEPVPPQRQGEVPARQTRTSAHVRHRQRRPVRRPHQQRPARSLRLPLRPRQGRRLGCAEPAVPQRRRRASSPTSPRTAAPALRATRAAAWPRSTSTATACSTC